MRHVSSGRRRVGRGDAIAVVRKIPSRPHAERSLDSLLNLIDDLVADRLRFFRLLFRSRALLSAEVLLLRKQLAFYQERQVQRRLCWDRPRVRQPRGEGLPFLPFRLQGGFTIPPCLRFARPPYNAGRPSFSGPV